MRYCLKASFTNTTTRVKETYNALNAPNNMDGINNQFTVNPLNQVLDNSYQKFLPGNDSYNALGDMEQVKALKFYDLILNFNLGSENLESALFFKQISQYAKGLRHKILTAPSSKKELEQLKGKDPNTLQQEIQNAQENALKLEENIKAIQNHTETLKNAINQKEQAKNPIQEQKQNLERQKNEKEREKHYQENAKQAKERERQNLNHEINTIGNERITLKKEKDLYPQINGELRATIIEKNQSVREYYQKQKMIYELLGFFSFEILNRQDQFYSRMAELAPQQQRELYELIF